MTKCFLVLIGMLMPLAFTASADQRPATNDDCRTLALEVAKLKQDLRQLRFEYHQFRVAYLERELQQAAANRVAVQTEGALLQQDLQELEEQLSKPLDNESYINLSASKTEMTGTRRAALDAEQRKASQREAEFARLLELERQKLQALVQ